MASKRINVSLPSELQEQLRAAGETTGIGSLSAVLRVAATDWLRRQQQPPAKRRRLITKPIDDGHLETGTESPGNLDGRST